MTNKEKQLKRGTGGLIMKTDEFWQQISDIIIECGEND